MATSPSRPRSTWVVRELLVRLGEQGLAGDAADLGVTPIVERIAAQLSSSDPDRVVQLLTAKFQNEPTLLAQLSRLDVPVVAVNPGFKSNDAASLAAHGVELDVIPDVGHFTMMEDPDAFNVSLSRAIVGFSDTE